MWCHVAMFYLKPSLHGRQVTFTFCHQTANQTLASPLPPSSTCAPNHNCTSLFEALWFPLIPQELDFQTPLLLPDLKPSGCAASAQHMALPFCPLWSPKDHYLAFKYDHMFLILFPYVIHCLWGLHKHRFSPTAMPMLSAFRGLKVNVGRI